MENVMEKPVNISNDKLNVLEFDIEITGVDETDMEVRFVIESDDMDLGFNSKKISQKTWVVEIPAMKILDGASYPYHISVVVDGYAFKGITGNVNILNSDNIKASGVKNTSTSGADDKKPTVKKTGKKATKAKRKLSSKPTPLNVKNTEEILNDMLPEKGKTSKPDSGLDASIVKTIEKARKETSKKRADNKMAITKNKEVLDDDIDKIIKKAEAEVKSKVTKKDKIETKEDTSTIVPKADNKTVVLEEEKSTNGTTFSAKKAARDMIKSVTGIGKKKVAGSPLREAKEKKKAEKVKEIISAEAIVNEKAPAQTEVGGKKIIRGKSIVEVDSEKENKIKEVLKDDENNRVVTTTPINKTIH